MRDARSQFEKNEKQTNKHRWTQRSCTSSKLTWLTIGWRTDNNMYRVCSLCMCVCAGTSCYFVIQMLCISYFISFSFCCCCCCALCVAAFWFYFNVNRFNFRAKYIEPTHCDSIQNRTYCYSTIFHWTVVISTALVLLSSTMRWFIALKKIEKVAVKSTCNKPALFHFNNNREKQEKKCKSKNKHFSQCQLKGVRLRA